MKGGNTVRIVFAVDENYVMPLAASVQSIIECTPSCSELEIAIISCNLSASAQRKLLSSWGPVAEQVRFIDIDMSMVNKLPMPRAGWLSPATYARLFLPELLPDSWQRIIYLDADTITLGPLAELWHMDLAGMPLAAIQDLYIPYISSEEGVTAWQESGLSRDAKYFNAGVLLMDIGALRRGGVFQRALDYLGENSESVRWYDQEALNAAINGRFLVLDQTWNVMWYWFFSPIRDDAPQIIQRARVRHFSGPEKPWIQNDEDSPWGTDMFFKYLDQTAWRGWRP